MPGGGDITSTYSPLLKPIIVKLMEMFFILNTVITWLFLLKVISVKKYKEKRKRKGNNVKRR